MGRRALLLATLLAGVVPVGGCSSAPAPSEPEGQDHLEFRGVEKSHEPELRDLVAPDLKRWLAQPRDTVLDDAVFRLQYHFRFEGYADVKVTYERTAAKVIFTVDQGTRVTVGRVHFYGNSAISTEDLKAARPHGFLGESVPFSHRLVAALRDQILAEYGKKGYIEAQVDVEESRTPEDRERVHLSFVIKEGRRFTVAGIEGPLPDEGDLWLKLGKFILEPYSQGTAEAVEATAIDYLRDHGRPFAQAVATPEIDSKSATVRLKLEVREGPRAKLGAVHITGNEKTRGSFVLQRADLEEGKPYKVSDLRRAEERLRSTRLFRSARVAPGTIEAETNELQVEVTLEEREAGEASVRGGYGTLDGPRAGVDLAYTNLFGGAEQARVGGTISALGYRAESELAFPYFFGTDFRPGVTAWLERREFPSFDTKSYGALGTIQYPIAENIGIETGLRYAIIRTSNVDPLVPPGDLLDFAYTALLLSTKMNFVDNERLPTRGVMATAGVDWSPEGLRSDVVFVSASGRVSGYVPLPLDLVLASSFQGGIILPRGKTEEIPISLRFFAGGENSVRGFKANTVGSSVNGEPTGGEVYMALQTEVRFPIWEDIHGAVFTDQGGVWFDHNHVAIDEARWSVGLGLRYYTAAGAFVLDAGWNPKREKGEKSGAIAFSVGFPF